MTNPKDAKRVQTVAGKIVILYALAVAGKDVVQTAHGVVKQDVVVSAITCKTICTGLQEDVRSMFSELLDMLFGSIMLVG